MLRILFTSDYEIHGDGSGSPRKLMVETTDRMLALFAQFGARLTIMADVAEIMRFERHWKETGRDEFAAEAIMGQLRQAVAGGHDVQLHLHPSYLDAVYQDGRWRQDYAGYDFARLGFDRIVDLLRQGKAFLERALRPARSGYRCTVFRAANWSMQPSADVVRALVEAGILIDTSVFKYGRRQGLVSFDYAAAWSDLVPWPVSRQDVCLRDPEGKLFESPIYAERRRVGAFLTPQRVYRAVLSRLHRVGAGSTEGEAGGAGRQGGSGGRLARFFTTRHAWKMDFNQCTGGQLISALRRVEAKSRSYPVELPVVLIGHSKLFTRQNAWSLGRFLRFVADRPSRFAFGTFADVDYEAIRRSVHQDRPHLSPQQAE